MRNSNRRTSWIAAVCFAFGLITMIGCENKKKLLDVETPGGGVEVKQDRDTGEVEVEVDD